MTILYQWQTGGDKPCYACSRWNGQIFYTVDSLPELPVHPHCECSVRAFDTYATNFKNSQEQLTTIITQANENVSAFNSLLNNTFLKKFYSNIQAMSYGFEQIYRTGQIFLKNFEQMKSAGTIGADKYFHSKANAQAAQLGKIGEKTAKFIGDVRELSDTFNNTLVKGMTLKASIQDSLQDLKANRTGRNIGKTHPLGDMREFIERHNLPGVDDDY